MHIFVYIYAILNAIQLVLRGGGMEKFKIPVIPSTTNKTIRFPDDVIDRVEKAMAGTSCTFSAFVIEAVRVALRSLEEDDDLGGN